MPSMLQDYNKDEKLAASRIKLQNAYTTTSSPAKKPDTRDLCQRYMQGLCTYGRKCKYSHNKYGIAKLIESKRAAISAVRKNGVEKPCIFFTTGDYCHLRNACPNLHDSGFRQIVTTRMQLVKKQQQKPPGAWSNVVKTTPIKDTKPVLPASSVTPGNTNQGSSPTAVVHKSTGKRPVSAASSVDVGEGVWDTVVDAFAPKSPSTAPSTPGPSTPSSKTKQETPPILGLDNEISDSLTPCTTRRKSTNSFAFQAWNPTENWDFWARRNLKDEERLRILGPYMDVLNQGRIPPTILGDHGTKAPSSEKFERFSELPYELRAMIWKYVLDGEKYEHRIKFFHEEEFGRLVRPCFWPQNAAPRLLHVCSESRALAMVRYPKILETDECEAGTWFNYKADRLFIQTRKASELWLMKDYFSKDARNNIRMLCIPLRDWVLGDEKKVTLAVCHFRNLHRLYLVVGDGREDARVVDKKYHAKQISALVALYWKHYLPKRPAPKVILEEIPAVRARVYKIDNLLW